LGGQQHKILLLIYFYLGSPHLNQRREIQVIRRGVRLKKQKQEKHISHRGYDDLRVK